MAAKVNIVLMCLFILFHLAVMMDWLPMEITWGGQISNREELLRMEAMSILFLSLGIGLTLLRLRQLRSGRRSVLLTIAMWLLVGLFALNSLGNLLAQTWLEKSFVIVTVILTLCCLRLALAKPRTT